MGEASYLREAAIQHDWERCSRIMFEWLSQLPRDCQTQLVKQVLQIYERKNWLLKHHGPPHLTEDHQLESKVPLDHADAEFEDAFLEYLNGKEESANDLRIRHLASAIRSVVVASQFDQWAKSRRNLYERFRAHKSFAGSTFLEDPRATAAAEATWKAIDDAFASIPGPHHDWRPQQGRADREVDENFRKWDASLR
jgi:hypothetical protein